MGNVTEVDDAHPVAGGVVTFTYDALDRLTDASGLYDTQYEYNEIGNLTEKGDLTLGYPDPELHLPQPHGVITTSESGSFEYDKNGNMVTRQLESTGTVYTQTWDYENRLESVSTGSVTTTFVYNGDGALVKRVEGGQVTVYVGQHFEKDVTADEERTYYYFSGQRVAMDGKDGVQYIAGDHLGTTSLVLDDQGSKVAESRHYPYGEERWRWPEEGTFPTDHRFTGQRLHSYTQLYHMGARHYDPALGRWISADTLVPDPSSPQSFNRYSWVLGNPLKLVDPNGEAGVPPKLIRGASGTFLECGLRGRPTHYQLMGMGEFDDTHNMFDAIGLRLDASAGKAVAADINAEGLWNVNTQDFDIYWTPGLQGPSIGLDVSFGVIAAFGLRDNAGYEGSSSIYGGTLDIGIGIEIDVAVSDTPYQGMTPVVVFVGVGLGAEAGIYFGESVTRHVVDSDELIDDFNALIEGIRAK